jgi:hypothetical protein
MVQIPPPLHPLSMFHYGTADCAITTAWRTRGMTRLGMSAMFADVKTWSPSRSSSANSGERPAVMERQAVAVNIYDLNCTKLAR